MDHSRIFTGVLMIHWLTTTNENGSRGDPLAEGKPAGRPSKLTGHCDGARAGTGPPPTEGRAHFVIVGALAPRPCRGATCGRPCSLTVHLVASDTSERRRNFHRRHQDAKRRGYRSIATTSCTRMEGMASSM